VKLDLEDVGPSPATNQYVKSLGPSEKDANVFEVRVGGTAPTGAPRTVVLSIDGKEKARKTLTPPREAVPAPKPDLNAGSAAIPVADDPAAPPPTDQSSTALFADLDLGTGAHRATVTLEPADALPQDDQFFSVIEHREPRALIIGANASGDDVSYFAA